MKKQNQPLRLFRSLLSVFFARKKRALDAWPLFFFYYDDFSLPCLDAKKTNNSHTHATRTPHTKNNCALLYKFLKTNRVCTQRTNHLITTTKEEKETQQLISLSDTFAIERHQISGLCRYVITHLWKLHSSSRRRRQTPPHSQEFSKTPPNVDSCFYYETRNRSTHIVQQNAAKRAHRAFPKAIR